MSYPVVNLNGINGHTGKYLLTLSLSEIVKAVRSDRTNSHHLRDLMRRVARSERTKALLGAPLGVAEGIDDKDLAQSGWGVVLPANLDTRQVGALKEALKPLLELRREQAGDYYREFAGLDGYQPSDTKTTFLERFGADSTNAADPNTGVPYYLLLVGDPEQIPFNFQCELDVIYAVGRVFFETLEQYANYARTVVAAEQGKLKRAHRVTFFGVQNPNDGATALSATQLVKPLALALEQTKLTAAWEFERFIGDDATKSRLSQLLNGPEPPSLLFTASHGLGFPKGHAKQLRHQGALLCQDWPGPQHPSAPVLESQYFSADDVSPDANLAGMMAFHFACYSGGTPKLDDYSWQAFKVSKPIAEKAFVARLPLALLGHTRGGALAVIAHIERAWGYSFMNATGKSQVGTFNSTLNRLLKGQPVGVAFEFFNARYAAWATTLTNYLQQMEAGLVPDIDNPELKLAELWTAQNDSRGYAILGDPAARLPIGHELAQCAR